MPATSAGGVGRMRGRTTRGVRARAVRRTTRASSRTSRGARRTTTNRSTRRVAGRRKR